MKYLLALVLTACGWQQGLDPAALSVLYEKPLPPPDKPLRVFHLGHSLVGRDMPAMLEQLAGPGHDYRSQLGWGATLQSHWEPDVAINGFEQENAHPRYQDAREAVLSGQFDSLVLTEMVEIKDAIKSFDSPAYLRQWARLAHNSRPTMRVYLYETWHPLDDPRGWLQRLDDDLPRHWEGELLAKAMAHGDTGAPVYVIPAGQVMARFVRRIEDSGGLPGMSSREDLFELTDQGTRDNIHINDLGNYMVALTHYAVLYHRSPVGLPHRLLRADGSAADAPGDEVAKIMQEVVWEVVTRYPKTGVAQVKD
ncbi:hypothetical protein LPB72_10880 [Hydrogenophaga crassostreae]|uniref:DUF4886 domain-containing protein n=1 Tax=Hydrogenophaga crassostreae TaxID=1763535 RepID=A0A167HVX3_9BURK|nr:hypothetical protein [Hydrogenophaga crassostreae]AOW13513.1 hypothetical protein LPB072_12255 [Hydrogenophaga crassostreae]OAD41803.1 hypothetical protein LPB72_10880 [Hydrogenophaga crassostreae]